MTTKGLYTLREDKQELTKQLGCMNGIFQLFDRRYLLGQRNNQKKLPQGGGIKEIKNASEKPKEKLVTEKHRESIESSRNSVSSSCSSLDCSKRLQTTEPMSPTSNKQQDFTSEIKNVVKESMSRKPRVVPVKTVAKDERKGPTMTHVDSPRPLQQQPKTLPYERKDQNLAKFKEISRTNNEVSRFSCDGRELSRKLKPVSNIKDLPRLSLDSKRPSSTSLVARLMGLEALDDVINGGDQKLTVKPSLDDQSRLSSNKMASPRVQLESAPWGTQKQVVHKKASKVDHGGHSVYGQIEKRLTEVEFKSSGKDLRALKQILEAIQRTKMRLEETENQKIVQKTENLTSDSMAIPKSQKVKKINVDNGRRCARMLTPIETKAKKPVSNSRNSETLSPKLQRSKNEIEKQPIRGVRKQSKGQKCNFTSHVRSLSQQSDTISFPSESDNTSVASQNEQEVTSSDWSKGNNKSKYAERLIDYKPMTEQPSPVSVLDAFYTEETLSPIKKKSYAFKDDEDVHFDEQEWSQVGIDNLAGSTRLNLSTSNIKIQHIKHLVHQIELLNSNSGEATMNPHEALNENQRYIKEILLSSGILKNLDCATTIVHLNPTGSLIDPELFNILEKTKETLSFRSSKSEKMRRKLIFDTVDTILVQILRNRKGRILNGETLLREFWSEIDSLQINTGGEQCDVILNAIAADVNKDWNDNCNEVPDLALDIERLIFRDLINEIVNSEVGGLQDGPGKHCRKLFLM